ncbi:MAG: hypothetical protein IPL99_00725 [Candidatus Competibacteraceae bacterium]|nr:hypothetical protein [Candidatus Competibacteraceae bacterium]
MPARNSLCYHRLSVADRETFDALIRQFNATGEPFHVTACRMYKAFRLTGWSASNPIPSRLIQQICEQPEADYPF